MVFLQCFVLASILVLILMLNASVSKADFTCSNNSECDDKNICTRDYCKNETDCPPGCTYSNCTSLCTIRYYCDNNKISGCDQNKYITKGSTFYMGEGACEEQYVFDSFDKDTNRVIISGLEYEYSMEEPKKEGYKLYVGKRNNQTYNLRFNETTEYLYLESVLPDCPLVNTCLGPNDCKDSNSCTLDDCLGTPLRCWHKLIVYCKNDDKCCPKQCTGKTDSDCRQCSTDSQCNDNKSYTKDTCDQETFKCVNENVTTCISGDSICPLACTYSEDTDCQKPIVYVCGDKRCEGNETKENCCNDCGCDDNKNCVNNQCTQTVQQRITGLIDSDPIVAARIRDLSQQNFSLAGRQLAKKGDLWEFTLTYRKGDIEKAIEGSVKNETTVIVKPEARNLMPFILLVFVILIIITGVLFFFKKKPKIIVEEPKSQGVAGQIFSDNEPYSSDQQYQEESRPEDDEEQR